MKLKLSLKSTSVLLLGGAALGTWFAGACGAIGEEPGPEVSSVQGELSSDEIDYLPTDYVRVPGGRVVHKDCVHEVPDGAEVGEDLSVTLKGRKIAQYARCSQKEYRFRAKGQGAVTAGAPVPATGSGWVEASWATTTSKMFTQMDTGGWTVPPAPPTQSTQTIFFFPSFVSYNGATADGIVQPVLQWGPSAAGGGKFWAMANWILSSGATFFSTLHSVSVGNGISGKMELVGNTASSQTWKVSYSSPGFTSSLTKSTTNGLAFTTAQAGVLEAYNISQCSHFPGGPAGQTYFSTYFSRPRLFQGNSYADRNAVSPTWSLRGPSVFGWTGPSCGFGSSTVSSAGDTTLWY